MELSTAKRRINKTLDELCKSVVDDWYANFKSGYIKGYEDARQGKSPMYAEAYKVADTPQTDIHDLTDCDFCKDRNCKDCEGGKDEPQTDCYMCKWMGDRDVCGRCRNRNLFAVADTPQTDCGWK